MRIMDWSSDVCSSDLPLFAKRMTLVGQPQLIGAPRYASNPERVANMTQLDTLIGAWTSRYEADLLLEILDKNDIPSCKVYTAADCAQDAQYRARGLVRDGPDKHFGSVLPAGIVPHVQESPGCGRWTGPADRTRGWKGKRGAGRGT